jgi:hypothetical protein
MVLEVALFLQGMDLNRCMLLMVPLTEVILLNFKLKILMCQMSV